MNVVPRPALPIAPPGTRPESLMDLAKRSSLSHARSTIASMRQRSLRSSFTAASASLALASSAALAQQAPSEHRPASSSLNWVRLPGAESCITARTLAESVERRIGRSVFVSSATGELAIEGRVERANDGWTATITITRADGTSLGTRTLTRAGPSCRALDESIELVLVLAIDPDALQTATPNTPPSTVAPSQREEVVRAEPIVRTVERVRVIERPVVRVERIPIVQPVPWRWGFALGGGINVGFAPSVAPMVWGAAEVTPPRFVAIELSGGGGASIAAQTVDRVGVTFNSAFAFGGVALCPRMTLAQRVRLGGCVGVQLGPLRWTIDGAAGQRTSDFFLASAHARGSVSLILLRPVELQLDGGAVVSFVRPKFVVTTPATAGMPAETVTVFESGPVAAQVAFSVVVRFPP